MHPTIYEAFGTLKITEQDGKIIKRQIKSVINKDSHSFSYAPETINVHNRNYQLNFPLRCLFEKEDDHFNIQNELLDIYATGKTMDEAEHDFNEEFDYLYQRLNSLDEKKLTVRLNIIKAFINRYVKQVTNGN